MRNNQEKSRKYTCNSDYFKDINTEEKAYWFGFIYADGYITHPTDDSNGILRFGLSIMEGDFSHLEKFKSAISSDAAINHYTVERGYKIGAKYCRIIISDNRFAHNLLNHGLVERKSNIVEPPIGVPKELEKHFIRGFMDANGSIVQNKPSNGSTCDSYTIKWSSTESVLKWIMRHLIDNNILSHEYPLVKRKEEHIVTAFEFGGNYQVKKYLDYVYDGATVWLDRKHDRYLRLCKILEEREKNKRINKCAYCGTEDSSQFIIWTHGGEYDGKIVCGKHYQQLNKYGKIIPDKKDSCDICGNSTGKLLHVGSKYPEYHGMTLCKKHYDQLISGRLIDNKDHENEKLCDISSTYDVKSA